MTGEGGSESLRMSFLEAVYGFWVSFLARVFFNVMVVSGDS